MFHFRFSSLRLRLLAGFIGVALVLLIPCAYALLSLETLGDRFRSSYSEVILPMQHWGDFRTEVATASSVVSYHIAEMNPERMAKAENLAIQHMRNADSLLEAMKDVQGTGKYGRFGQGYKRSWRPALARARNF